MTRIVLATAFLLFAASFPVVSADHHCDSEIAVYTQPSGVNPGGCCECVSFLLDGGPDLRYIYGDVVYVGFVRGDAPELPEVLYGVINGLGYNAEPIELVKANSVQWRTGDLPVEGEGTFTVTVYVPNEPSQTTTYRTLAPA